MSSLKPLRTQRRRRVLVALVIGFIALIFQAGVPGLQAVMFEDSKHGPLHNTEFPPRKPYRKAGSQWLVSLNNGFYGAAIGPRLVCTSGHIPAGPTITYRGMTYRVERQTLGESPRPDSGCLNFIVVKGDFPDWAPHWRGEPLRGSNRVLVISAGNGRGQPVTDARQKLVGYFPEEGAARLRWWVNRLWTITTMTQTNSTCPNWSLGFVKSTGEDGQAVTGDSGGPAFIEIDGVWKFLGPLEAAAPVFPSQGEFQFGSRSIGVSLIRDLDFLEAHLPRPRSTPAIESKSLTIERRR